MSVPLSTITDQQQETADMGSTSDAMLDFIDNALMEEYETWYLANDSVGYDTNQFMDAWRV